jgi:pimeloyl-ACP methyl ester carboxylesterase
VDPSLLPVRLALNSLSLPAPRLAGRAAYALYRRPLRRGRLRPGEAQVHGQAVIEEFSVNGKRVVAYRWGEGSRPVLLLHGWRSRASRFSGLIPRLLSLGLSAVAFDAPGHGESGGRATTILEYRELIVGLQQRYGPFEAVVAHSFGVNCAFLALREGVVTGRLVAVAGVAQFRYLVDAFCARLGLNGRIERELVRRIETVLFPDTEGIWDRFDATSRPADVPMPILVVHDEGDTTVPLNQARRLKAAYGDRLDLMITRGLGHRRILRDPAVLDRVTAFLSPTQPRWSQTDSAA